MLLNYLTSDYTSCHGKFTKATQGGMACSMQPVVMDRTAAPEDPMACPGAKRARPQLKPRPAAPCPGHTQSTARASPQPVPSHPHPGHPCLTTASFWSAPAIQQGCEPLLSSPAAVSEEGEGKQMPPVPNGPRYRSDHNTTQGENDTKQLILGSLF